MQLEKRHLTTYQDLFVTREDIHARQNEDGGYFLKRERVTDQLLINHLAGRVTIGLYALDVGSLAKWAVLDADSENGLEQLQQAHHQLAEKQLPSHLEQSRRGGHLWLFMEAAMPGAAIRNLVQTAVSDLQDLELYPKQDSLDQRRQVGSLIKGPLGIHRKSGHRYPFLDPENLKPVSPTVLGTIDYLAEAEKVSVRQAAAIVSHGKLSASSPEPSAPTQEFQESRSATYSPIVQLKEQIGDAYNFISQFVELDESGKGHCPFHPPDHHPSFSVNRAQNYWVCFHEYDPARRRYLGGDALSFYVKLKGISYKEAVDKLKP